MAGLIHTKLEESVEITWRRNGKLTHSTVITQLDTVIYSEEDTVVIGLIGIGRKMVYEKLNAIASLSAGFNRSVYYVKEVLDLFGVF